MRPDPTLDEQVARLALLAVKDGDAEMVRLCGRALAGKHRARTQITMALRRACGHPDRVRSYLSVTTEQEEEK